GNLAGSQTRPRFGKGHYLDTDVLMFFGQPVNAAETAAVDAATKQAHCLAATARARQIAVHRHHVEDLTARFLLRLAARHCLRRLAPVDNAGHELQLPQGHVGCRGANAELLDHHHGIPLRIIGQYGYGMPALEHLAPDLAAPAAGKQAVTKATDIDAEVSLV